MRPRGRGGEHEPLSPVGCTWGTRASGCRQTPGPRTGPVLAIVVREAMIDVEEAFTTPVKTAGTGNDPMRRRIAGSSQRYPLNTLFPRPLSWMQRPRNPLIFCRRRAIRTGKLHHLPDCSDLPPRRRVARSGVRDAGCGNDGLANGFSPGIMRPASIGAWRR
jgi:hypothetical protein